MVTQKYAIKSHLISLLSSRNHRLVFTVKIQLDDLVDRHYISLSTGMWGSCAPVCIYLLTVHQRLPW